MSQARRIAACVSDRGKAAASASNSNNAAGGGGQLNRHAFADVRWMEISNDGKTVKHIVFTGGRMRLDGIMGWRTLSMAGWI